MPSDNRRRVLRNANTSAGNKMLDWNDLGKALSEQMENYPYTTPIDAISAYVFQFSRTKLVEQFNQLLLIGTAEPGQAHRAFCNLPFDIVCTTNFDFLLEDAYKRLGKTCNPIVNEDQLSITSESSAVTLLKLHGDLHHPDRMVVTEEDYDTFLNNYRLIATYMANLLISRTPIFIGYSLEDPDFRQLWQVIRDRLGRLRRPAYALSVGSTNATVLRFQRRGATVINLPGGEESRGSVLESSFNELSRYWSQELPKVSTITEEQPLSDLSMPLDAHTGLCFFSLPARARPDIYSFYRTQVFPIAEANGFNPITAEDFISPGENYLAKVATLIDRAEVVVADLGSGTSSIMIEINIALMREKKIRHLLVVAERESLRPPTADPNVSFILRLKDLDDQVDEFLYKISDWFKTASRILSPSLLGEPARLLQKGEYRAAVISAMTVLESALRERIASSDTEEPLAVPFSVLLKQAQKRSVLTPNQVATIKEWMTIRNRAVHSSAPVDSVKATEIVEGVTNIIHRVE